MADKTKEIREWINVAVGIATLMVLIIATIFGATELHDINVNLEELKTQKIHFINENGTKIASTEAKGQNLVTTLG